MAKDKRQYISELSTIHLIELIERLLPNIGMNNIKLISENVLEAFFEQESIGSFKTIFIIYNEPLNKSSHLLDRLLEIIEKKFNAGASKIYLISNHSISTGFRVQIENKVSRKKSIEYWELDDLYKMIESKYPEYWRHNDQSLIEYEKDFEKKLDESFEIKKLVEYKAAHQKLLQIFIEPNLFLRTEDKQSTQKAFTKINIDKLIDENERLLVLNGDPGVGKTRLLNEIGRNLIKKNTTISGKRYLPVFIDSVSIRDSFTGDDKIDFCHLVLKNKLNHFFDGLTLEQVLESYTLVLLIDSIDEFEEKYQKKIRLQLDSLMDRGILIFIGTRSNSLDDVYKLTSKKENKNVYIQKFNDHQVESFALRYFEGNGDRAQSLIDSMKENKVLEKLPLTPLNLSLMSILYEETNQEVPSTLTDVYDKFSSLLLGRTMVDKSIDFLDITLKENIIGLYALELITRKNGELMTTEEFIAFIKDKMSPVSGTIDFGMLPQALNYIIEHTGLLILYKGKYVKFRHDSYMEYFAAKEIFKNHRELEVELVNNFFDVNWQYAAVFYAGWSRKMPKFLTSIIQKVSTSNTMKDYWSSANGMGYLLQALYLTDDNIRKEGIKVVLEKMVDTYECFKKLSTNLPQNVLFNKFPMPILGVFPIFIFQDNFDSITLKNPLSLALDELLLEYESKKDIPHYPYLDNIVYRILILSLTVSSNRLNMENKLLEVIGIVKTTGNEFYTKLLEVSIDNLGSRELRKQKDLILKPKRVRISENSHPFFIKKEIDNYLKPASRNRFTIYDTITPNKKVKLFVEGPTDASLIEHAFTVLTGHMPYWEIRVGDSIGGGANGLAKALSNGFSYLEGDEMVIGIFDNDAKGLQEFNGELKATKFNLYQSCDRIKISNTKNIYGILLPVPHGMQYYIKPSQKDNYFSIEHYLPNEYLEKNNMLVKTAIDNIYKINDSGGSKTTFTEKILKLNSVDLFQNFILLFKEIDKIAGVDDVSYTEISNIKIEL